MNKAASIASGAKKIPFKVIIIFAFTFIIQSIHGFYAIYDISPPSAFGLLSYFGLFWLIGDWFMKDSKKNSVDWAFDMGFFLYISWPIFIPYYLFKTRGFKRAAISIISFIVIYFGSFYLSFEIFYLVMP